MGANINQGARAMQQPVEIFLIHDEFSSPLACRFAYAATKPRLEAR
jgi:hypothetical protein